MRPEKRKFSFPRRNRSQSARLFGQQPLAGHPELKEVLRMRSCPPRSKCMARYTRICTLSVNCVRTGFPSLSIRTIWRTSATLVPIGNCGGSGYGTNPARSACPLRRNGSRSGFAPHVFGILRSFPRYSSVFALPPGTWKKTRKIDLPRKNSR